MAICSSLGDCFSTMTNSIEMFVVGLGITASLFAGLKATNWYKGLRKASKARKAIDKVDSIVSDLMRFANEFKSSNGGKLSDEVKERLHTTAKANILESNPKVETHLDTDIDTIISESVERVKGQ
jgi:hypothetical protein